MEKIFFEDQDQETGRHLVVEEEENGIWAYLTFPDEIKIDKDCFLGSRQEVTIKELDIEELKKIKTAPTMTLEYATKESHLPDLQIGDISAEWGNDGNVVLKIHHNPFLLFIKDETRGFSKAIAKNGMYGNSWNEEKYRKKIEQQKKFDLKIDLSNE